MWKHEHPPWGRSPRTVSRPLRRDATRYAMGILRPSSGLPPLKEAPARLEPRFAVEFGHVRIDTPGAPPPTQAVVQRRAAGELIQRK